jgi:hypothetical protein
VTFGMVVIALSVNGHRTVISELKQQKITGTPDMTPTAIKDEVTKAGLKGVSPSELRRRREDDRHGQRGAVLRAVHERPRATRDGRLRLRLLEMGQYATKPNAPKAQLAPGGGTNNTTSAQIDPKTGAPVQNAARNVWVTETALSTAHPRGDRLHRPRPRRDDAELGFRAVPIG